MSKNKFFAAIFALRIYHFVQVPNAGLGHVQASFAATLALCICRLSSDMVTWVNGKSFLFFDFVAEDFYF